MRIDGKLFLLLLGLATLVWAGATLSLWPRAAGRGARPAAGRIVLLLGTQLSLAATFLFTINAAGGFYTSWGQLFGTTSSRYRLARLGPASSTAGDERQLSLALDGRGPITGLRSGLKAQLAVYTPAGRPGRDAPAGAGLPVEVVDLTGGADGEATPDFQKLADDYRVLVAVVTDPSGGAIPGVNVPQGPQGELFWGQDLRTALVARYRVDSGPADWGIAGVGMSGDAAINLAVQDSTRYGLAAAAGDWTEAPEQDSWPGIDRFLESVPAPPVRLLYNDTVADVPGRIHDSDGPLLVAARTGLDLTGALDWLGASIDADRGVAA